MSISNTDKLSFSFLLLLPWTSLSPKTWPHIQQYTPVLPSLSHTHFVQLNSSGSTRLSKVSIFEWQGLRTPIRMSPGPWAPQIEGTSSHPLPRQRRALMPKAYQWNRSSMMHETWQGFRLPKNNHPFAKRNATPLVPCRGDGSLKRRTPSSPTRTGVME